MHCSLFATLKAVLVDNDLWFQNTCHNAVLIGYKAGKKGEVGKKRKKKRKEKENMRERERERNICVKIALQIQSELTSTIEILYLLTISFYLKQGKQHSTDLNQNPSNITTLQIFVCRK